MGGTYVARTNQGIQLELERGHEVLGTGQEPM